MMPLSSRRPWSVLLIAVTALAVGGCTADTFSRVTLGTTDHKAVAEVLGPQAVVMPDGFSLDVQNAWPTTISLLHVAVPDDKPAQWKLQLRGRVVHLVTFQTLNLDVVYEGPLSPELLKGLRSPDSDKVSEFRTALVGFLESRARESMTDPWKNPALLKEDRYRSRFVGVFNVCMSSLRGQGDLTRTRFSVNIDGGGPASLHLRYLGDDHYRIEMTGTVSLGPLPVL